MTNNHRAAEHTLSSKESLKGNSLSVMESVWLLVVSLRSIVQWRIGVGARMEDKDKPGFETRIGSLTGNQYASSEDLAGIAKAFARFQKQYCDDQPHSPEELRIIHAPLWYEPS